MLTYLLIATVGCAYPISYEISARADADLTYPLVARNPALYTGKTVIWGGVIVLVQSRPNQSILTIQESPLDFWGMPRGQAYTRGRFIARVLGPLDEGIYSREKKVTLAGEIAGEQTNPLVGKDVRYPVVRVQEIHLFGEKQYYPTQDFDLYHRGYRHHYDEPSPFHGIH